LIRLDFPQGAEGGGSPGFLVLLQAQMKWSCGDQVALATLF